MRQRHVRAGRDFLAMRRITLNLGPNCFSRGVRYEALHQAGILAIQAKEKVLRFYLFGAELTGFVAGEKDYPAGLFGVPLEHTKILLDLAI
jgi:hypothetical protein